MNAFDYENLQNYYHSYNIIILTCSHIVNSMIQTNLYSAARPMSVVTTRAQPIWHIKPFENPHALIHVQVDFRPNLV